MSNWAKMQAMLKSAPSSSAPSSSSFSGSSKPKKRPRPQELEGSDGTSRSNVTLAGRGGSAGGNSSASGAGKPQPFVPAPNAPALLEPGMQHYEEVMQRCFKGFVKQPADALPPGLDRRVIQALERLKEARLFHHDVVTNGGIRLGATVVRRILVGEPGITYKYLGLRTFAHPWRGEGARKELAPMLELNELMTTSTRKLLAKGHGVGHAGSCAYNLSLVNLLEPSDARGGALRNRAGEKLGTGSLAVSWHADSSVQPASSIAVVNLTLPYHKKSSSQQMPWRIAMKCVGEGHEPDKPSGGVGSSGVRKAGTPAVAVPLSASETYYLLGEFNDHHHHAVLAGDAPRYSSTHRVGVVASDTWKYISDRCAEALPAGPAGAPPRSPRVRCYALHNYASSRRCTVRLSLSGYARGASKVEHMLRRIRATGSRGWSALNAHGGSLRLALRRTSHSSSPRRLHHLSRLRSNCQRGCGASTCYWVCSPSERGWRPTQSSKVEQDGGHVRHQGSTRDCLKAPNRSPSRVRCQQE